MFYQEFVADSMAAADSTHVITCPKCSARFAVSAAIAGRRARCAACETPFTVPAIATPAPRALAPAAPPKTAKKEVPDVGLECRVCGTRMYAAAVHAGKKIKCPDCGALTVIPEPVPEKAINRPSAMDGEQYELWDADSQPLPSELIKLQPKHIAVVCEACGTLMQPLESQIGKTIACSDCGKKTIVQAPKVKTRKSVLAPDIEIPGLDLDTPPAPRPSPITPEMRARIHAEEKAAADTKIARKTDHRGRPVMPRWPLLSGIVPFLFSPGVPVRWLMFTIVSMGFDAIAMYGLSTIGGLGGGMVAAGMGAIAGLCFLVLGLVISMVWLAALSSTFFDIVTESSEGHDVIQQWPPPNVAEWFPELVYYLIAITVSGVPGWAIAHFTTNEPIITALATAGGMILAFPLIILSQLDGGSAFSVVSPRIFQSLFLCPFSWLMFYVETAFLVSICVAMGAFLPSLAVTPVLVMCVILYARLLGRLGWRLAESMGIVVE